MIGVIVEVGMTGNVNLKTGGTKPRRNISIADENGLRISASLWGNLSNQFDF